VAKISSLENPDRSRLTEKWSNKEKKMSAVKDITLEINHWRLTYLVALLAES
jgi:hypothetical protein